MHFLRLLIFLAEAVVGSLTAQPLGPPAVSLSSRLASKHNQG